MERKLSTIVAADVVGYSSSIREDETGTIYRISLLAELLKQAASRHQGRLFNRAGDGFLLEFPSPVTAVRCAYEVQMQLAGPAMREQIGFDIRIGVHLADVVVDGDDLLGDGVNVASRIEAEAVPGTVLVSSTVFEHVKRTAQLKFENMGERQLKNIAEPITVFSIVGEVGTHSCGTALVENELLPFVAKPERRSNSLVVVPFKNMSNDPDQEYFGKLANQYSNDPASKANFGQVPPIQKHGGRPELEKEAFSLQSGEISKVVQVGEHWVIMYCQGRTTPRITNIDDVRDELRKDIHEKKLRIAMAEQFEKLRENAQIDNFLAGTSQAGAAAVRSSRQTQPQESRPGQLPFRGQR